MTFEAKTSFFNFLFSERVYITIEKGAVNFKELMYPL